jgi:hypothetical protein
MTIVINLYNKYTIEDIQEFIWSMYIEAVMAELMEYSEKLSGVRNHLCSIKNSEHSYNKKTHYWNKCFIHCLRI